MIALIYISLQYNIGAIPWPTWQAASELKTQIVQSPERIRREINDNGARIEKEQGNMSALSQKSAELNTKADFIDQAMTVGEFLMFCVAIDLVFTVGVRVK